MNFIPLNPRRGKRNSSIVEMTDKNILIKNRIIADTSTLPDDQFFNKRYCDRETLFSICLQSIEKTSTEKRKLDVKLVSKYLSEMGKFIALIKNENNSEKNNTDTERNNKQNYFIMLKYVSNNLIYDYHPMNRLIMKYGDEGDKFYIILSGTVAVLIPIKIKVLLSANEYSRYIALLLLYKEYQIAKQVLKENSSVHVLDIPDFRYIAKFNSKNIFFNDEENIKRKTTRGINKNISRSNLRNFTDIHGIFNKHPNNLNYNSKLDKLYEYKYEQERINEAYSKMDSFIDKFLTIEEKKLYYKSSKMTSRKSIEFDEGDITTSQEYINRISDYKGFINFSNDDNYDFFSKLRMFNNINISASEKNMKLNQSQKNLKIYDIKNLISNNMSNEKKTNIENDYKLNLNKKEVSIYEYQKVTELTTGDMFGDVALSNPLAKRTASIITITNCHFGCLNEKIYRESLKEMKERSRKTLINYISQIKILNNIPSKTLDSKYFNYFALKYAKRDELLLKVNEPNPNILFVIDGTYEISFVGKLNDIYTMLNEYKSIFSEITDKKYTLNPEIIRKIENLNEQKRKISKIYGESINKELEYKIFLVNPPNIFGLKETEKFCSKGENNYYSFLNIKCVSKGQYLSVDKTIFYKQIYSNEIFVKEETKMFNKEFVENIIKRLFNILYSKIWSFFMNENMKIRKLIMKGNSNELGINLNAKFFQKKVDVVSLADYIINTCSENIFDSNKLNDYVYKYWEKKKFLEIKEKREFKPILENVNDVKKIKNFIQSPRNRKLKNLLSLDKISRNKKYKRITDIKNVFSPRIKKQNFNVSSSSISRKNFSYNNSLNKIIKKNNSFEQKCQKNNLLYFFDKKNNMVLCELKGIDKKNKSILSDLSIKNMKKNSSCCLREKQSQCELNLRNCISANRRKFNASKYTIEENEERKSLYMDQRKKYVLKNTKDFFTRYQELDKIVRVKKNDIKNVKG